MARSMKAAKREVKSALNLSNQNVTALFLKGNFEYVRHNYRKSVKLLNSCPKTNPHVSGQYPMTHLKTHHYPTGI